MKKETSGVFLCLLTLSFSFPYAVFSSDGISAALSYSPGLTDRIVIDESPRAHSRETMALGLELNIAYLFRNDMGIGTSVHWGEVSRMTVEQGSNSISTTNWSGAFSQASLALEFLYAPVRNRRTKLILGVGPSFTLKYYASEYGSSLESGYLGLALGAAGQFTVTEHIFLHVGLSMTGDFIEMGKYAGRSSFFQIQVRPALGFGFRS